MLSKEKIDNLLNILSLNNNYDIDSKNIIELLTAVKNEDDSALLQTLFKIKYNEYPDTSLFDRALTIIKHEPELEHDILDSFSNNQVWAKTELVNGLDKLDLLNKDTEVVIWGCWYGSVLIPLLHDKVKKITAIDVDDHAIEIGKNRLFKEYDNVEWISENIFGEYKKFYNHTDIFINTSCEHMLPMKWWGPEGPRSKHNHFKEWDGEEHEWPVYKNAWWKQVKSSAHFAFTSNNMFDIEGHINCVKSVTEFKHQLPPSAEVLHEDSLKDERGTRWLLIGKL